MAERMATLPGATLPNQMRGKAELKASYRLLDREGASLAALSQTHWKLTREAAAAHPLVLFVEGFTTLNLAAYAKTMQGLGRVGSGNKGWGMMVYTTLAVLPGSGRVLGVAHQQVLERLPLDGEDPNKLEAARSWAAVAEKTVHVPARNGREARDARVMVSYGEVDLCVPKKAPLHEWVVRAWEVDAPSDVEEPLKWVSITNRPVCSAEGERASGWRPRVQRECAPPLPECAGLQ